MMRAPFSHASQARWVSRYGHLAAFVTALNGRIEALTAAHELLSRRNWHGISLVDLVHRELAPYATPCNTEIKGPDDMLSADAGQVIGMILHELVTNGGPTV